MSTSLFTVPSESDGSPQDSQVLHECFWILYFLYFLLCKVEVYSLVDSVLQSLQWFILIQSNWHFETWIKGCERGTPLCTLLSQDHSGTRCLSFVLFCAIFCHAGANWRFIGCMSFTVWFGLGVLSSLPPAACLYDSQTHLQHALWLSWFCFLHTLPPIYTCICITLLTLFSVTAEKKFLFAPVCMHQLFWEM